MPFFSSALYFLYFQLRQYNFSEHAESIKIYQVLDYWETLIFPNYTNEMQSETIGESSPSEPHVEKPKKRNFSFFRKVAGFLHA